MNEIKVKIEMEKKIGIPKLRRSDGISDELQCIIDDRFAHKYCGGIHCKDCICNIDNLMMLANSQNLQLL